VYSKNNIMTRFSKNWRNFKKWNKT